MGCMVDYSNNYLALPRIREAKPEKSIKDFRRLD